MNSTTNNVLISVVKDIIGLKIDSQGEINRYIQHFYDYHGEEDFRTNHSHDNWTSIYCWYCWFGLSPSELPLFGHHSLRPDNFFFYLRIKYPLLGIWFWPIVFIPMVFTTLRRYGKDNHGNTEYRTSGMQLTWLKLKSVNAPISKIIINYLVLIFRGSWSEIFSYYYKNDEEMLLLIKRFGVSLKVLEK